MFQKFSSKLIYNSNTLELKKNISLCIFLFINFIFCVKYLSRITTFYIFPSIAIVCVYLLLWRFQKKLTYISKKIKYIIIIYIGISLFLFYKIPVSTLNVDRWSVITSFWDAFFEGRYAYFAKSNVGNPPGPMPFYFILALPFYLFGELGYYSLMGIISFYYVANKNIYSKEIVATSILLIISSVFYFWEVSCRSNILFNGTLVLIVIIQLLKKDLNILKIGILIGLVLSTRNVYIIPFIISFIYLLKQKKIDLINLFLIGSISLITFLITFLPFIWNHFEDFKVMNPFIIQSSALMPFNLTLIFILFAFLSGVFCKSILDVYFYSEIVLFLTIVCYFLYHFYNEGLYNTFINSTADISYFILCIPFSIYHLMCSKERLIKLL